MAENEQQSANLIQALKLTQQLRSSVSRIFYDLSDGLQNAQGNEKTLLNELQKSLITVNNDSSDLEKIGANIHPITNVANCSHLSLDPLTDKTPLYSQLLQSYKWSNKVHELAGHASTLLKRSMDDPSLWKRNPAFKKLRRPTSHAVPPNMVDTLVANVWSRMFPDMSITVARPLGSCSILQITLGKTLKSLVALRGLLIEWVNVKGYKEEFTSEDGKLDLWSKSKYHVFQKVTEHATAAMLHFYIPNIPEMSVKSFLMWFRSYHNLFSVSCQKCGKHLYKAMPPTMREYRSCVAFHEACRQ